LKVPSGPPDPTQQAGDAGPPVKAELVFPPSAPPEVATPTEPRPAPAEAPVPLAVVLAALWLLGAGAGLAWSGGRLMRLYRWATGARTVREEEWTGCLASLATRHGSPAVALREHPAVPSALTMGLFRSLILLPTSRRTWSAQQRSLILAHELAHVRRRDFLAGLLAELVACLCWFHPVVRWLVGQLRLEQEYAADAWAASATSDSTNYVRCLARLALEQEQGRGSPAPAFWRRRPELLRRIE